MPRLINCICLSTGIIKISSPSPSGRIRRRAAGMRERLGARSNVPRFLLQTNRGLSIAGDGGVGPFNRTKKVVGGKAELYPAMPGADIDALMEDGAFVHEDGIMFFPGQR